MAKIIFLGDKQVGTTCLVNCIINHVKPHEQETAKEKLKASSSSHSKSDVKVTRHHLNIHVPFLSTTTTTTPIPVQLYDVTGGDLKSALVCQHRATSIILLYDISDRTTFEYVRYLLEKLINPRIVSFLLGNNDFVKRNTVGAGGAGGCSRLRKVSEKEGYLLSKLYGFRFMEVSAGLDKHSVWLVFEEVVKGLPRWCLRGGFGNRSSSGGSAIKSSSGASKRFKNSSSSSSGKTNSNGSNFTFF